MKNIYKLLFLLTSLITGITSCEIDNFPLPDATVYGAIRDSVGSGLVETDLYQGSTIGVYELGKYADNPVLQTWYIKQSGEYRNTFVYSNTYKIEFTSCNFFPYTLDNVVINPGENNIDFLVVPFIRIKNVSITHDAGTNTINATFNLEAGKPTVKLSSIALYAFTDIYVGERTDLKAKTGPGGIPKLSFSPAQTIDPETVYTLTIDLTANANLFAVHRNYYFRVGAKASQGGVGTIRSNYAPYVKITL